MFFFLWITVIYKLLQPTFDEAYVQCDNTCRNSNLKEDKSGKAKKQINNTFENAYTRRCSFQKVHLFATRIKSFGADELKKKCNNSQNMPIKYSCFQETMRN